MTELDIRTAVVIGGTRGIGLSLSKHFARSGFNVALCGRNSELAKDVANQIENSFGRRVIGYGVDASSFQQCEEFRLKVSETFSKVDLLYVNAAVFGPVGPVQSIDSARWIDAINTNLLSFLNPVRAFLDLLKESDVATILTMSGGGIGGSKQIENASSYVASKAALVALVETFAIDLMPFGITINAIAPGFFPTGFMDEAITVGKEVAGSNLFADATRPKDEDVSAALSQLTSLIDFLISRDAREITGRICSARWDSSEILNKFKSDSNTFRLRRVDQDLIWSKLND